MCSPRRRINNAFQTNSRKNRRGLKWRAGVSSRKERGRRRRGSALWLEVRVILRGKPSVCGRLNKPKTGASYGQKRERKVAYEKTDRRRQRPGVGRDKSSHRPCGRSGMGHGGKNFDRGRRRRRGRQCAGRQTCPRNDQLHLRRPGAVSAAGGGLLSAATAASTGGVLSAAPAGHRLRTGLCAAARRGDQENAFSSPTRLEPVSVGRGRNRPHCPPGHAPRGLFCLVGAEVRFNNDA